MEGTRRVTLVAISPAQRAARRARPAVLIYSALAVLVALALLLLPAGPTLAWTMGLALSALLLAIAVTRRVTGSPKPLSATSSMTLAVATASVFFVGGAVTRYFTSLLLAPLLGPPEPPTATLVWSLPVAVLTTAFMVWAARPIKPR